MIDQESVIRLAMQSGVIDSADIDSIHISQAYIDDLAHFADLAMQVERANVVKILSIYASNLLELGAVNSHHALQSAIEIIEEQS